MSQRSSDISSQRESKIYSLAVKKRLTAPTFLNLRDSATERDTTKKANPTDRSLKDLPILFRAFLTYSISLRFKVTEVENTWGGQYFFD